MVWQSLSVFRRLLSLRHQGPDPARALARHLAPKVRPLQGHLGGRNKILAFTAAALCALAGPLVTSGDSSALTAGDPAGPHITAAMPPALPPASGPAAPARAAAPAPPSAARCLREYGLACYSPRQIQRAYDLTSLYAQGLDGQGRTIVIVDSFGSPTIRHDLRVFDSAFGLPGPPSLRVLQPAGRVPPYDAKNPDMVDAAGETTADVEAAHTLAPGASILLVETPAAETLTGGGFPQFMAAENYVVGHDLGDVISQSFGIPEQNFPSRAALLRLRYAYLSARRHHVTVLAATNDFGVTGPTKAGGRFRTTPVVELASLRSPGHRRRGDLVAADRAGPPDLPRFRLE